MTKGYKRIGALVLCVVLATVVYLNVSFTVFAAGEKVFGRIIEKYHDYEHEYDVFIAETDNGNITATNPNDVDVRVGVYGWFTFNAANELLTFEELPEADYEIGYLTAIAYQDLGILGKGWQIKIVTDTDTVFTLGRSIYINQVYTRIADTENIENVENALKSCIGAVAFQRSSSSVSEINSITSGKYSAAETTFNSSTDKFVGCDYKVTNSTLLFDVSHEDEVNVLTFSDLRDDLIYGINVMSYDRYYNARAISITKQYKNNVGFYYHTAIKYVDKEGNRRTAVKIADNQGVTKDVPLSDAVTVNGTYYDDTDTALDSLSAYHGVIEYKTNGTDDIFEINTVDSASEFTNIGYNKATKMLGDYDTTAVKVYTLMDKYENLNHEYSSTRHSWLNEALNEDYVYSGNVYTLSDNSKALWTTAKKLKPGIPIVTYYATAYPDNPDNRDNRIRILAEVDRNGFEGHGRVYMGVYKNNSFLLGAVIGDIDNDEIGESICIDELTADNIDNYSVIGYVWDERACPLYKKTLVEIQQW